MVFAASGAVIATALGAAVAFGLGPVFAKRGLADDGTWILNTVVVVGVRVAIFWVALVATARLSALADVDLLTGLTFGAAGVTIGVGRFVFYKGVDDVGSTLANAFVNTRPLFAVLLAVLFLQESVSLQLAAGVLVLVLGLVVLSLSEGGDISGWKRLDLVWPLLGAALFGLANILRRLGFLSSTIGTLEAVAIGDLVALLFVLGASAVISDRSSLRSSGWTVANFVLAGVCGAVGIFLLFWALSLEGGVVAVVDPLNATAPLFTTVLAVVLLRDVERVTIGTAVGIAVVVLGVALVSTG